MISKPLFYVLSWTWGIVLNLIGHLVALVLLIAGYRPCRIGTCMCFKVGKNWGGASIGSVIICGEDSFTGNILSHEIGHSVQNCIFGPLCIILVTIPSAIRYQYRNFLIRSGKKTSKELPPYDSIWFEGQATKWGKKTLDRWSER